jgi:hypothetical protein
VVFGEQGFFRPRKRGFPPGAVETGDSGVGEGVLLGTLVIWNGGITMKNGKILKWLDANIILIGIFFSTAILIFLQSYVLGAHISPDSTNYLRAAQSLRDGYGLYVNAAAGDTRTYFSIWPIGYPAMIALISLITGTEIYLASKILSVIILGIICGIFYCRFKKTAWVYALIITNFGFLQIFWYTWSEQPFILGLVWISCVSADILKSENIRIRHYISICLASLFLFFSRYVGAFSAGVIGLLALYCFGTGISRRIKERIKKALLLSAAALVAAVVMTAYLYVNKLKSGYATGTERVPIKEHPIVLFLQLCLSQIREMENVFSTFFTLNHAMAIILCMAGVAACFLFFRRHNGRRYISAQAFSFLAIGLLYWCSIVAMRFSAAFDGFSYRLLFPASALFLLGIISIALNYRSAWIDKINAGYFKYIAAAVIAASLFSYSFAPIYHAARRIYKHEGGFAGYRKIRSEVIQELDQVPPRSLIITAWGNKEAYVNFMRPDLITISPAWPLRIDQHSKIEEAERVYIYLDWEHPPTPLDVFFSQYKGSHEKLLQIK